MKLKSMILFLGISGTLVFLNACSEPLNETASQSTETETSITDSPNNKHGSESKENDQKAEIEELEAKIFEPTSKAVLVNKVYSLNEDYVPSNLVPLETPTVLENPEINQLQKTAADALKIMISTAEKEEIYIHARSGYRSYQTQVSLFDGYVARNGEAAANKYSARPGQSEHQTGLAIDVTSDSVNNQLTEEFGKTIEGTWISVHAHEFGFIIRYPEGKEDITGYQYEPWHLRFLGNDLAKKVYNSGLTYEEYLKERGLDIEI